MNRYSRGGGVSNKATASTLCQKCLKRGHYSFDCKESTQLRPYAKRPSRTAMLQNPKLLPKLTADAPQDLLRKKGLADELLTKAEKERGRKRRQSEDPEPNLSKRMRSRSSSISVSTISTRSPSPHQISTNPSKFPPKSWSQSPQKASFNRDTRSLSLSKTPPRRQRLTESERKRRRESLSSFDSYTSDGGEDSERGSKWRASSRNTRRRYRETSPAPVRGRKTENGSPCRGSRRLSTDRPGANASRNEGHFLDNDRGRVPRERSLSPFSKRLALTKAMNMDR